MLDEVYSARILDLAGNIGRLGRLDAPDATATRRAPLCGSTITVDIRMDGDVVADYAHEVKACALGQASASILAAHVLGRSGSEIATLREQLKAMLKSGGPVPSAPFGDYEVLLPARDYRNRHASILLALDATLDAIGQTSRAA